LAVIIKTLIKEKDIYLDDLNLIRKLNVLCKYK
jgi:hypothetical protein